MPPASAIDSSDKHKHRCVISAAEMNDVDYVQFYSSVHIQAAMLCCVVEVVSVPPSLGPPDTVMTS